MSYHHKEVFIMYAGGGVYIWGIRSVDRKHYLQSMCCYKKVTFFKYHFCQCEMVKSMYGKLVYT